MADTPAASGSSSAPAGNSSAAGNISAAPAATPQGSNPTSPADAASSPDAGDDFINSEPREWADEGAQKAETPKADDWPADIMERAKAIGFTEEDAKGFGSKDQLAKALTTFDKALVSRQHQQAQQQQAQQLQQTADQTAEATAQAAADKAFEEIMTALAGEEGAMFDPLLVKAITGLKDHFKNAIKAEVGRIEGDVAKMMAVQRQKEAVEIQHRLDGHFDKLPEEFHELFGTGDSGKLEEGTLNHRREVVRNMGVLLKAYQETGQQQPTEAELHRRAVYMLHGDKADALARKKIEGEIGKRRNQMTNRPTARKSDMPKGREAALNFLRQTWPNGIPTNNGGLE